MSDIDKFSLEDIIEIEYRYPLFDPLATEFVPDDPSLPVTFGAMIDHETDEADFDSVILTASGKTFGITSEKVDVDDHTKHIADGTEFEQITIVRLKITYDSEVVQLDKRTTGDLVEAINNQLGSVGLAAAVSDKSMDERPTLYLKEISTTVADGSSITLLERRKKTFMEVYYEKLGSTLKDLTDELIDNVDSITDSHEGSGWNSSDTLAKLSSDLAALALVVASHEGAGWASTETLAKHTSDISALNTRVDSHEGAGWVSSETLVKHTTDISSVNSRVDSVEGAGWNPVDTLAKTAADLVALGLVVVSHQGAGWNPSDTLVSLATSITNLSNSLNALTGRVGANESDIFVLQAKKPVEVPYSATIVHNLGYRPIVQVLNSSGDVVSGVNITHTNNTQFTLSGGSGNYRVVYY